MKLTKVPATVTFECEISKADLEVKWFHGDTEIKKSKKFKPDTRGKTYRLTINDAVDEDEGPYSIKVKSLQSTAALIIEGKFLEEIDEFLPVCL